MKQTKLLMDNQAIISYQTGPSLEVVCTRESHPSLLLLDFRWLLVHAAQHHAHEKHDLPRPLMRRWLLSLHKKRLKKLLRHKKRLKTPKLLQYLPVGPLLSHRATKNLLKKVSPLLAS
jgi:hypothetical protein